MTLYEEALESAAKELGREPSDWNVERLASLRLMLAVARHRWSASQTTGTAREMLDVMAEITALLDKVKPAEGLRIELTYVEGVEGRYRCQHCSEWNELAPNTYTPATRPERFAATPVPCVGDAFAGPQSTSAAAPMDEALKPAVGVVSASGGYRTANRLPRAARQSRRLRRNLRGPRTRSQRKDFEHGKPRQFESFRIELQSHRDSSRRCDRLAASQ
jgi:hypothetical protein